MDKSELVATLESKYYKVASPTLKITDNGIERHEVVVFDKKTSDVLERRVFQFFVEDAGQPTEAAYWEGREPKGIVTPNFETDCETYIASKIADGTIEAAFIKDMSDHERAIADAYIIQASDIVKKVVLLDRYQGQIRHRLVA